MMRSNHPNPSKIGKKLTAINGKANKCSVAYPFDIMDAHAKTTRLISAKKAEAPTFTHGKIDKGKMTFFDHIWLIRY